MKISKNTNPNLQKIGDQVNKGAPKSPNFLNAPFRTKVQAMSQLTCNMDLQIHGEEKQRKRRYGQLLDIVTALRTNSTYALKILEIGNSEVNTDVKRGKRVKR